MELGTESQNGHARQRRARSQLSCTPCRQGKLKCNRAHPVCDQCLKRNRDSSCIYLPPPTKTKTTQNVKGRIRHLEKLVVDLMNGKVAAPDSTVTPPETYTGASNTTTDAQHLHRNDRQPEANPFTHSHLTPDDSPDSGDFMPRMATDVGLGAFGHLKISKNETSYVGESHWTAILDSIDGLKRDLADDPVAGNDDSPDDEEESPSATGAESTAFLLGSPRRVTRNELLQAVPPKRLCDRLLSQWFNAPDPFKPIIHAPTFQEEYNQFWQDPQKTPVMWIGLFFAILSLATSYALRSETDPSSPVAQKAFADADRYHQMAASAAVLGNFANPKQYTLECLILYAGGLRSATAYLDVWLVCGFLIRLALRMGYHRDPSHFNLSPYQAEMRRRTWYVVYMADILLSFQLGLPSMLRTVQSDTQAPRNLYDSDFNVHTTVLPPARPIEDLTPASYGISKVRICTVFATAAEMSHATTPPSYGEIMDLDHRLNVAVAHIPPSLKIIALEEALADNSDVLMCRINLDLLCLKTRIVLHRRFMRAGATDPSKSYSRSVCLESAMKILRHHHAIWAASQPGGQLDSVRWYMGSISTHDFLLAAMVICLGLSQQSENADADTWSKDWQQQDDMIEALEKSQKIWEETSLMGKQDLRPALSQATSHQASTIDETTQAAKAMAIMLRKIKKKDVQGDDPSSMNSTNSSATLAATQPSFDSCRSMASNWVSPNMSLSGFYNDFTMGATPVNMNDFSVIDNMLDVPDDVNWQMWDQQIGSGHAQDPYANWTVSDPPAFTDPIDIDALMQLPAPDYSTQVPSSLHPTTNLAPPWP